MTKPEQGAVIMNYKKFRYPVIIKEHHLDIFNHVNNAKYLEIFEEARWEFLHDQGINLSFIQDTGIGPVVLECTIQFLKELKLRQIIWVESQMISYEKKIGLMHQHIIDETGELCSKAIMTFGVFDLKKRKLILPPSQWLNALGIES